MIASFKVNPRLYYTEEELFEEGVVVLEQASFHMEEKILRRT